MNQNSTPTPYRCDPPMNVGRAGFNAADGIAQEKPSAVTELDMIASLINEIHNASSRVEAALDRLTGGRPQAVNVAAPPNTPANSMLSKLIVVREQLSHHLGELSDHAQRLEKFV